MNVLIFSDTHGRIPLMLRIVAQFQQERATAVDLVLVTGDLGIWPDLNRLDNSTRKYCNREPAELSFLCFNSFSEIDNSGHELYPTAYLRRARTLLESVVPEIRPCVVFIGGNHEDYEYLLRCRDTESIRSADTRIAGMFGETASNLVPVEQSRLIWWLPPGKLVSANGLKIAGLSGIDAAADGRDPDRYHEAAVLTEEMAIEACLEVLESLQSAELDVLLTHDGIPDAVKPGKGSAHLAEVIKALNPRHHFFGHYHRSVDPNVYRSAPGIGKDHATEVRTLGVHLNKLAFRKGEDVLRDQIVAHLHVNDGSPMFNFVKDDWLSRITRHNWWHAG